jgi:hypothetical protein
MFADLWLDGIAVERRLMVLRGGEAVEFGVTNQRRLQSKTGTSG